MFRRIAFFNLFLVMLVVFGGFKLRRDSGTFWATHRLDRIQPDSNKPMPKGAAVFSAAPQEDWSDIAAHNPFSFDRNDVTLVASTPASQQPKRPKPFLFGLMRLGNDRLAMLGPGDPGNRSYQPVRIGQTFDGWKLVEIADKSVVVQWDEIKESVILNDPTAQIPRADARTAGPAQASVVTTVSSQPAPAASAPNQTPLFNQPPPPNCVRKQIIVRTPFGNKTMDDPDSPC